MAGTSDHGLGIATIRAYLVAEFEPHAQRVPNRNHLRLREVEIGGLSCLVAEPVTAPTDAMILYFFGGGYVSGKPKYVLPIAAPLASPVVPA